MLLSKVSHTPNSHFCPEQSQPFSTLPDEMVTLIFSKFIGLNSDSFISEISSLAQVCKRFNQIAKDDGLKRTVIEDAIPNLCKKTIATSHVLIWKDIAEVLKKPSLIYAKMVEKHPENYMNLVNNTNGDIDISEVCILS